MLRVQREEPGAFEDLYRRHWQRALRAARAVNPDRAEDAAQEGFLSVWRNRRRYRNAGSVEAWIVTIVRRRALDLARADSRAPRPGHVPPEAVGAAPPLSVEDDYIARGDAERVRDALLALPGRQREVLVLAYFGGLSQHEIAKRLALPDGTVKGRMRLGLQKLRAAA